MQHRYVPDLGDFSKFAVIDALSDRGEDRTALIWYLVNPHEVGDHHNNDGKHTVYLENDRHGYAQCQPQLYERFQAIHRAGEKNVSVYSRHNVLPNIGYFDEPITYDGQKHSQREAWRAGWVDRATATAEDAGLVVLDPDNGLLPDRLSVRSQSAVKYASLDECSAFSGQGRRSLVVYQHAHRQGSAQTQASKALQRLANRLGVARGTVFALRFHRGTTRFYLVVPAAGKADLMRGRAEAAVNSAWGRLGHFSLID
jgi:hypothetical protein